MRRDRRRALVCLGGCAGAGLLSGCAANDASAASERKNEAAMVAAMSAPATTLPVTLEVEASRSAYTAALEVRVSAHNDTGAPLDLLLWNTPFESVLSADLFEIVREDDDEPLSYRGRLVKRVPPPPDEAIVTLAPGERIESVLDLSRYYALDRPGRYAVSFASREVPLDIDGRDLVALRAADAEPLVVERF